MMKLVRDGTIVLGLTQKEVALLARGHPLFVDGADIKIPGKVIFLTYGNTEVEMQKELVAAGYAIPG